MSPFVAPPVNDGELIRFANLLLPDEEKKRRKKNQLAAKEGKKNECWSSFSTSRDEKYNISGVINFPERAPLCWGADDKHRP